MLYMNIFCLDKINYFQEFFVKYMYKNGYHECLIYISLIYIMICVNKGIIIDDLPSQHSQCPGQQKTQH